MIHVLLPFMALALYGVMRKIDPSYLRPRGWNPTR
jgi:ABC-type spermidine/putrescine transport system permease subunit I